MAKQVRETAAGKSVSAWVVLNRKGQHVATVNAHYGNNSVSVDVWNLGQNAVNNSWDAAIKCGKLSAAGVAKALADCTKKRDWISEDEHEQWAAFDVFGMQQSSGGGYRRRIVWFSYRWAIPFRSLRKGHPNRNAAAPLSQDNARQARPRRTNKLLVCSWDAKDMGRKG